MIRARVADDFAIGGIAVLIDQRGDFGRMVAHVHDGHPEWDQQIAAGASPGYGEVKPTLRLDEDMARALLDALANWYGGTSEAATARADLLHERKRVDQLLDTVSQLACRPQELHVHKALEADQ